MSARRCMRDGLLGVNRPCDHQRGSCSVFMLNWVVNEHVFCRGGPRESEDNFSRGYHGLIAGKETALLFLIPRPRTRGSNLVVGRALKEIA